MENTDNIKLRRGSSGTSAKAPGARKQPGAGAAATPAPQPPTPPTQPPSSTGTSSSGGATTPEPEGHNLMQQARETTGEIMNQVQQRAGSQLARQKESAATDLSTVVNAVRQFGQNLTGEQNGPIAHYAAQYGDKAANNLERFATYLRDQDPKQLLNDVQNFGRRRPALLLGGAFLLGFAGARLIKSSMEAGEAGYEHGSMDWETRQRSNPNLDLNRPSPGPGGTL